jgi:hypothetical protein
MVVTTGTSGHYGTWIRNRRRNLGFAIGWGMVAAAWFALALGTTIYSANDSGLTRGLPVVVFLAALGVLVAKVAIGCARAGIKIDQNGVVVRGPWTTRRFPLASVSRFRADYQRELQGRNPTPGVVLNLTDGRTVTVWGLGTDGLARHSSRALAGWDEVATELNRLLEESNSRSSTDAHPAASIGDAVRSRRP